MADGGSDGIGNGPGSGGDRPLRVALREMGYLGGRLASFMSHDLAPESSVLATSLRIGVRAGLVSGVSSSVLLTALVAVHDRPPIADLALVALDFFIVYGLAIGLLATFVGMVTGSFVRLVRGNISRVVHACAAIAALIALLLFVYFLFWWWTVVRKGQPETMFQPWVLLPVIGIGIICAVLGRMLFVIALLFAQRGREGVERRAGWVWAVVVVVVLASFSGAAFFVARAYNGEPRKDDWLGSADLSRRPVASVIWFAVDGLDYDTVKELLDQGEMPALSVVAQSGLARLLTVGIDSPPALWNTVATALPPCDHGVTGFQIAAIKGLERHIALRRNAIPFGKWICFAFPFLRLSTDVPLSGLIRRGKAVWEIADEAGLSAGTVNWWATWPADRIRGFQVSDRAYPALVAGVGSVSELPGLVYPQEILSTIKKIRELSSPAECNVSGFSLTADEIALWQRSVRMDRFHADVFDHLYRVYRPDFAAVYLQGADLLFSNLARNVENRCSLPMLEHRAKVIRQYARFVDGIFGRVLKVAGDDCAIFWITAPGFRRNGTMCGSFAVYLKSSPGKVPPLASVYDIAPTSLALLSLPVSREMRGVVLKCVSPKLRAAGKVQIVESFGRRSPDVAFVQDQTESLAQAYLRSLGYIK